MATMITRRSSADLQVAANGCVPGPSAGDTPSSDVFGGKPQAASTSKRSSGRALTDPGRAGDSFARFGRESVEFGEHLTDDLGGLVSGERFATFGVRDFSGERFDGVDTADQHVAQRFAAGLRVVEGRHRRRHRMVG